MQVTLYRFPTVALVAIPTEVPIFNSHEGAGPVFVGLNLYSNSIITDIGELRRPTWAPGDPGGGPQAPSGEVAQKDWEIVLLPETDYIIRAARLSGTGIARVVVHLKGYKEF